MSEHLEQNRVYVVGFMFDSHSRVLLIEKQRPVWQRGKLNGIGGKVEDGETPKQAIRREFSEEVGIDCDSWHLFASLQDARGWRVDFFSCLGDISKMEAKTDEIPVVVHTTAIQYNPIVMPNLRWLIPMALSMSQERIDRFEILERE